nr:hypothetical protein [Xanthomonas campestris]
MAPTSRAHTALKIDPHYTAPTVWVKDASRAVGVAQSLISRDLRQAFVAANDADYAEIRARHRNRGDAKRLVSLEKARAQKVRWRLGQLHAPARASPARVRRLPAGRADRADRLDPVLPGLGTGRQVPGHPQRRDRRPQASELYRDARRMLKRIVEENG